MNFQTSVLKNEISFIPRFDAEYYLAENIFIKFIKKIVKKIVLL